MRYTTLRFLKKLLIFSMLVLVGGCGSGTSSTPGTGSIAAKLVWGNGKTAAKTVASVPAGVSTVRITISGSGFTSMVATFDASLGEGTINSVPAQSGLTVKAEGISSSSVVLYRGQVENVTVYANSTTNTGTITMSPTTVPAAPSALSAVPGDTVADLSWSAGIGASYYRVYRSASPGVTKSSSVVSDNLSSTTLHLTSITNGVTYYYAVSAINGYGESELSNEIAVTAVPQLTQLLANGDFENWGASWSGSTDALIFDALYRGYNNSAYYLDFSGNSIIKEVTQYVSVPNTASAVYLYFYYKVSTTEGTTSTQYDKLQVRIIDNSSYQTVKTISNLDATSGWTQSGLIDLTAYKGRSIGLQFYATSDSSASTTWSIDNVTLGYTMPETGSVTATW